MHSEKKDGKLRRDYSQKTLKVLFALSGNQCAHPECKNPVIVQNTEESDTLVLSQICHIYALNEDGPRGREGLTEKELNAPENLVLLCPTHHVIIDGQHETYPADMLKEWKRNHEVEMQRRLSAHLESVQPDVFSHPYFPTALVDQKIAEEVDNLRKSRFFAEFDRVASSLALERRLVESELSGGSDGARSQALAWCARLLSSSEELDKAKGLLVLARTLGSSPEIDVADAFIASQKGDRAASLQILAGIDTPLSRSAALMIVAHHDGAEGMLRWVDAADVKPVDLDSDGKSFLLTHQLELARWDASLETLASLTGPDFEKTPVLYHLAAVAKLVSAVPVEFRAAARKQVPFEAVSFPLASDAVAMNARRTAHGYFVEAAKVAQQLECPCAERIDDEYALWLELKDPAMLGLGKSRLEAKLRDPKSALAVVHLGLQFGIKLDLDRVERDINREIARNGGMTMDAALARFALAFTQSGPEAVAAYLARHHNQLATHIDKHLLLFRQIEMLARAGLPDAAAERLDELVADGIGDEEESRLRRTIAEAQGKDPVEARKQQFKETGALGDLIDLVDELETREHWYDLCEFGRRLFENTNSLRDAERLVNAYSHTQRSEAIVEFLNAHPDLLAQSKYLKTSYAWALYNEGAFLASLTELAKLGVDSDDPNYRALQVNLSISTGDWAFLSAFVATEYQKREHRSAHDLMQVAQLALRLGSPHARDLVSTAAEKAGDDAAILAGAYFLASSAGWENDPRVFHWVEKAAELSGDDGPLQRMSLKDVLDRKPEWDRRESETWRLLSRGEIPIFLAARSLHRSLVDLTLFPAMANLSEIDPRRRGAIAAYSGKRKPQQFRTAGTTVGVDAAALLTLSFLDLLDSALDAFETVYIPHSTLSWLFEERQRAAFHQPSRIRSARQILHLLATEALEKLAPSTAANSELSAQVGEELASLIAEAEKVNEKDDAQRIVVRSSPVYRLSTLMEEEADLSTHSAVLSSCLAVVDKLKQKGQITAEEEKRARAYLQLHERPWPKQPEISDGALLFLDDLAITYLHHLGMLGKLKPAGLRAVASPKEVSEANALISYDDISEEVKEAIERIRAALNVRIKSGRVKAGRRRNFDDSDEQAMPEHPTVGVISLASICDAAISDDRLINQHDSIDDGTTKAPIYSTLDLLDALVSRGVLSVEERLEYRTRLRRAGYFLMPVSEDELGRYLNASAVKDGNVIETAELKAVRESVLSVRMSDWLQLPKEAPWLDAVFKVYTRVLKSLWKDGADIAEVTARSNWIADQLDVRGWTHRFERVQGDNVVRVGRGAHILRLLTPPIGAQQEIVDAYWNWVEGRVLGPVKQQFPELYNWLVDQQERRVAELAEMELPERKTS